MKIDRFQLDSFLDTNDCKVEKVPHKQYKPTLKYNAHKDRHHNSYPTEKILMDIVNNIAHLENKNHQNIKCIQMLKNMINNFLDISHNYH
jgi:hypothetical protein